LYKDTGFDRVAAQQPGCQGCADDSQAKKQQTTAKEDLLHESEPINRDTSNHSVR